MHLLESRDLGRAVKGAWPVKRGPQLWLVRLIQFLGAFRGHGQAEEGKFCYPWPCDIYFWEPEIKRVKENL